MFGASIPCVLVGMTDLASFNEIGDTLAQWLRHLHKKILNHLIMSIGPEFNYVYRKIYLGWATK